MFNVKNTGTKRLLAPLENRIIDINPAFPIPRYPGEAITLSQRVAYLLSNAHDLLPESDVILDILAYELPNILHSAFVSQDPIALLEVHKTLYEIYEVSFTHPLSPICQHEHSPWLLRVRHEIEAAWLSYERAEIQSQLPCKLDAGHTEILQTWFIEQSRKETDMDKLVMNFLKNQASTDDFNWFILSEATLNYRFFDALALMQRYFSETVKAELMHNMWDESGCGIARKSHSQQFTAMLAELDLQPPKFPIWDNWQPYAGYNLYFCFGLNRKHHLKGLGSLAMPELFDASRNRAVVAGLNRLYPDASVRCEYFYNHIENEEEHGSHWLRYVIASVVETQPEAGIEMAIGGALRMEAMRHYNTYLAQKLGLASSKDNV